MNRSWIACFSLVISFTLQAQDLKIIHIDVGQGDATLIIGPQQSDGKNVSVLFDTGDIP